MNIEFSEKLLRSIFNSQSADELCQHIVHSVMNRHGIIGAVLCRLDNRAKLEVVGQYGLELGPQYPTLGLWSSIPLANAISEAAITNICWEQAPLSADDAPRAIPEAQYGVVCSPVWTSGLVTGGLQLIFNRYPNQHLIDQGAVHLLATAFEPYLSQAIISSKRFGLRSAAAQNQDLKLPHELTQRQSQILEDMASPKTYFQIASELAVSESLIKQEAGKIFKFLGVNSRSEAVWLSKELKLLERGTAAAPQ